MEIDWAVWGPPLAVLGAGVLVAYATLSRIGTDSHEARIAEESRRIDLESTRDEVVRALKHLEIDRDKLGPDEYARERERLVARGARAMEALDAGGAVTPAPVAAPSVGATEVPPKARAAGGLAPEWKGALYALLVVGVLAILWNFATQNTHPRGEGGTMTGSLPGEDAARAQMDPQASPQFKQRLAGLEQALAANPGDVTALDELCWLYVTHGDPAKAMEYDDRALRVDPKHHGARSCRSVITAMMGMMDKAVEGLDAVLAEDPAYQKAVTYRALILLQMARDAPDPAVRTATATRAAEGLGLALQLQPGNRVLDQALREAQVMAGGAGAAVPPIGPGSPPAAAAGEVLASGVAKLAPSVKITGGETVFVSVKDPAGGPPLASKKMTASFPLEFSVTSADIIAMGGARPMPAAFNVAVRIDADGNAMTRDGAEGVASGVSKGSTGIELTLE